MLAERAGRAVGDVLIVRVPDAGAYLCRITSVAVKRFRDVDASDAWLEGIGDRSLERWVCERSLAFARRAAELGCRFDEDSDVVLERFVLVEQTRDVAGEGGEIVAERVEPRGQSGLGGR